MDEISHGQDRAPRLGLASLPWLSSLSSAWSSLPTELRVAWAGAGVLIGAGALVVATLVGGHDGSLRPVPPAPSLTPGAGAASPASMAAGAPGTAVVGCNEDGWWNLGGGWQADSVRDGPVWLIGARATGYARVIGGLVPAPGAGPGTVPAAGQGARAGPQAGTASVPLADDGGSVATGPPRTWLMVVHVDPGATVVLRAADGSASYFQFFDGDPVGPYEPADGNQGLEFQACQRPGAARAGWVDIYNVGFSIAPGRSAAVEVLSPGSDPAWLTFTAPSSS